MVTFPHEVIASPGNGQQDVATKQHAREQGQQQDGDIKAIAPLAEDDAIAIGLQPLHPCPRRNGARRRACIGNR